MSYASVSTLAVFKETTAGTAPADWDADGKPLYTVGVPEVGEVKQEFIEDGRSVARLFEVKDMIAGVRSTATLGYSFPAHGTDQGVIADTVSAVAEANSIVYKNCMGGQVIVPSTVLAAGGTHSTTSLELDVSTLYQIGGFVCIEDADATGDTVVYVRRIISKAADVVGIDEALPFTPTDGDPCHSNIQTYIDEDVLANSASGPQTLSYAVTLGGDADNESWELVGCQTNLAGLTIGSNETVKAELSVMCGSFQEPDDFSKPTYATAITGAAGFIPGQGTKLFIQDYGTTTTDCINATEVAIEVGIVSEPIPTVTECDAGLEGINGHTAIPGNTTITTTSIPYDSTLHADLKAQQHKVIRFANQLAPGAGWAITFPNCEIMSTPTPGEAGSLLAIVTEFRAHEDDAIAGASVVEQQLSKLSIVQW